MTDSELLHAKSADSTVIAYEVAGAGPPLIAVGGALSTRAFANSLRPGLESRFTVIAVDRRGRGDSTDTLPYAVEREVEDLAAVIDAVGGSPFVYGHSAGGIVALRAVAAGVPISRLCVYEPPLVDGERLPNPAGSGVLDLVAAGRYDEAVEAFLVVSGIPPESIERARSGPAWSMMTSIAQTLPYDFAMAGVDPTVEPPDFTAITIPVLALDGGRSAAFTRASTARIANAIPGARHATIPDQRHNVSADAIVPVLMGFFTTPNV